VHYVIPGVAPGIARRHTGRNLELMGGIAELQPEAMVRKNAPLAAALQEARGDWASVNWTKLGARLAASSPPPPPSLLVRPVISHRC